MPESTDMTPIDEFDAWTEADDAFLRGHLAALRVDLDPHAMPEPALVRGRAGRERRTGRRTWALAGVAAAAAVAAAVVWNPLTGDDGGRDAVPGTTSPTVSTSLPSTPVVPAGPLPGAQAWRSALAVPTLPIVQGQLGAEDTTVGALCSTFPDLGRIADSERVYTQAGRPDESLIGTQARFAVTDPERALGRIADAFAACTPTALTSVANPDPGASESDPMVWSFTVEGKQGFLAAAQGRGGVSLIEVTDATAMGMRATGDGMRALAVVAQTRLDATAAATTTGPTSVPTSAATSGSSATTGTSGTTANLRIRRVGGSSVPATEFLSLAQWNAGRSGSAALVSEVPQEQTGTGVNVLCDPAADAGAGAINYLRLSNDATWVGYQRILTTNIASDGDTNAGEPAAMVAAFVEGRSCPTGSDPTVKVVRGPLDGTVKVTATFAGGVRPTVSYIGVTTMATAGHTTTIVLEGMAGDQAAWTEMTRLLGLAAQR